MGAIARWPEQKEGVADVGCGPMGILSLAVAVHHPKAHIQAFELNPTSAQIANEVFDLLGLSERVEVITGDFIEKRPDPNTGAAVTETFHHALTEEPGPQIVRYLHKLSVGIITPCIALLDVDLYTCTGSERHAYDMQKIDLRITSSYQGNFGLHNLTQGRSVGLQALAMCALYDDRGQVLVFGKTQLQTNGCLCQSVAPEFPNAPLALY